jgi:AraC-like DNA-binding protein
MPMIRFNGEDYSDAERFDRWREDFVGPMADVARLDKPEEDIFRATDAILPFENISLLRCAGTPKSLSRSRKHVADGSDCFSFIVNRRGALDLSQCGSSSTDTAPRIMMMDFGRPLERLAYFGDTHIESYNYMIPRNMLLSAAPNAELNIGKRLNWQHPAFKYLLWYTEKLVRDQDIIGDFASIKSIGDHLIDLIVLLSGPSRDAAEVADARGLRAARLIAILQYIESNISNPNLNTQMVAEHHGISTRYVSKLLEERSETPGQHILRLRLEKAKRMLEDLSLRHRRISDIAYACGFNDISYFNQAFKRRFSRSPRDCRG